MSRTLRELVEERSAEIVGRAAEKAALLGTLEEGGQLVVFVHGIAGVGKSTLLDAFAGEARRRGATVVRIDCRSIEPTERGFLDGLGGAVGGAPASAEELAERLAGLGERVVLVLDTYEVFRLLDSWMRQVFAPALRDNTRLVVAGRDAPVAIWYAAPGWSELVLSVRLGSLADGEAEELLARSGLDAGYALRINRLARGHPLFLELAAAAVRARPDVELEDIALQAILDELTELYLDGLDLHQTREARRRGLRSSAGSRSQCSRRCCPSARLRMSSNACAPAVRPARTRRTRRPRHDPRSGRARAARLRSRRAPSLSRRCLAQAPQRAADGAAGRAVAPHRGHALSDRSTGRARGVLPHEASACTRLEQATPADAPAVEAIVRRHEPAAAAGHLLSWWGEAPRRLQRRTRAEGVRRRHVAAVRAGSRLRTARSRQTLWRGAGATHLRRDPVPRGQRVLFSRRWLSAREGELPSGVQAAVLARHQARLHGAPPGAAAHLRNGSRPRDVRADRHPLGFVPLADAVQLDDVTYHSAVLDFGPSSVDGWLATLAARELLIEEDSILDPVERQLVLDGRRVDLTRLEFEVLDYLLQREGKVVERGALLRDVWGFDVRRQQRRRGRHPLAAQEARRASSDDRDRQEPRLPAAARRRRERRALARRRLVDDPDDLAVDRRDLRARQPLAGRGCARARSRLRSPSARISTRRERSSAGSVSVMRSYGA